jgi:hypothetical protein
MKLSSSKSNLKDWYPIAKKYKFEATYPTAVARNPYLLLEGGECLVLLAGGLLMLTDTKVHFGEHKLYLRCWCSDHKNEPRATVVSSQRYYKDGKIVKRNENYYRVAALTMIEEIAKWRGVPTNEVELDHVNRMRGDNRACNLRPADAAQNSWNKDTIKIEKAFYTFSDLEEKLASGEWVREVIKDETDY